MRALVAVVLVPLLTAGGCGSPRPVAGSRAAPARAMSDVTLGEPFEIARGTSVLCEGNRLRFDAVRSDSRCPQGTTCVRAGEAVVAFSFVGGQSIGEIRLQIPGFATVESAPQPEQSATRGGYRFTLLALDPYPGAEAGTEEPPVATIQVNRVGS
jgi:hypothetical protein